MSDVFVYGDSISMQYGFPLKKLLNEKGIKYNRLGNENSYDLASPIFNGFSTREMLKWINDTWESKKTILVFNCGLHDIVHIGQNDLCQVSIDDYERNLIKIIEIGRDKFDKMIFCNSTPVEDQRHNRGIETRFRYNADVIEYNKKAAEVMEKENIPLIDLYSITDKKRNEEDIYIDHVHMKEHISVLHAKIILDELIMKGYVDG